MEYNAKRALWALLLLSGAMYSIDIFSAVNSSPWTAQSFGGDPEKEKSLKKYIRHGVIGSVVAGTVASVVAETPAPMVGSVAAAAYMYWLYDGAIKASKDKGNTGWS
jgi:hypothetical protein